MAERCWHTVTTSSLPRRLRPGFWDNHGRCCGTAGVADGARWSNHEHRATPPDLEPRPGWAMGSAGIVRELLRYVRVRTGRAEAYAVAWPDHPRLTLT